MYRPKTRWTAAQIYFLKENFETLKDQEIADILGRTLKSVRLKRARLERFKEQGRGISKKSVRTTKTKHE